MYGALHKQLLKGNQKQILSQAQTHESLWLLIIFYKEFKQFHNYCLKSLRCHFSDFYTYHSTTYFSNRVLAKPKKSGLRKKSQSVLLGQFSSRFFSMKMSKFFQFGNNEILLQFANPYVTIENKMSGCCLIILENKTVIFLSYIL